MTPTCRCCHRTFTEFDADEVLADESGAAILLLAPSDGLCGPRGDPAQNLSKRERDLGWTRGHAVSSWRAQKECSRMLPPFSSPCSGGFELSRLSAK
jgi:hypothetical protein